MAFLPSSCLYGKEFVPFNRFLFPSRNPFGILGHPNCFGLQQGKFRDSGPFISQSSSIEPEKREEKVGNVNDPSREQIIVDKEAGSSVNDSALGSGSAKAVEKNIKLPTKAQPRLKPSVEERPKISLPIFGIEKLDFSLDGLQKFLAPRHKGDIRDVILMSISFAVYVYISQKLVCAYCMWQSTFKN